VVGEHGLRGEHGFDGTPCVERAEGDHGCGAAAVLLAFSLPLRRR
jgi:hypothetical protein